MDLSFRTPALAALCNSEQRLAQRWGSKLGRTMARRLLEVAAADAATLDRLPGAIVGTDGSGETVITFSGEIVIRGVIDHRKAGTRFVGSDAHMLISAVDVHGRKER